jgi:hypothetical protein
MKGVFRNEEARQNRVYHDLSTDEPTLALTILRGPIECGLTTTAMLIEGALIEICRGPGCFSLLSARTG